MPPFHPLLSSRFTRLLMVSGLAAAPALAQPSFEAPPPSGEVAAYADARREAYLDRVNEVIAWRTQRFDGHDLSTLDMASLAMLLQRGEHVDACNQRVIDLMREPGTGPFWMFPTTILTFAGREHLSADAKAAIREAWRTTRQLRGDTENHWVMYHVSLYLAAQLYAGEDASTWANGLSSTENFGEARGWLLEWMKITTTLGQGEYNATHYIGEYAIPMLMLATWAEDPAMRQRGRMMLDWIFAELANVTLNGVLRGPNSRTDDISVVERWNALATYFSWQLFGHTPAPAGYAGWGNYFAVMASHYEVPEVIHRIAVDRDQDILQRDRARSRRIWRYSDEHLRPIYKTQYLRRDYAVGSMQGGLSDPIQGHAWDVTWAEPDPRGKHNTLFSLHPHSSGRVMQMFFCTYPEPMPEGVTFERKPSYNSANKVLGVSPYEQIVQDHDTVVALYDIAPGERFQQVNGFFSRDLTQVVEHASGWIFARGGRSYLAYRPLAPYHWEDHVRYPNSGDPTVTEPTGSRLLVSPHPRNGTIVQAASVDEYASYEAFQAAILALPLRFALEPHPTVTLTTLRGRRIEATYGQIPRIDGEPVDYDAWQLFEGTHLNSALNSGVLTIRHGRLSRVLDFNTLSITDSVAP